VLLLSERRCAVDQWDAAGVGRKFQEHADLQLVRALQLIAIHVVDLLPARRSAQMIGRDRRQRVGFSDLEHWVTLLVEQDARWLLRLRFATANDHRFARRTGRANGTGRTRTVCSTGIFNSTGKCRRRCAAEGFHSPLKN
jgi:hypothetical protein